MQQLVGATHRAVARPENGDSRSEVSPGAARVLLLLSLAATYLVYLPTLRYEFVSDDDYQIVGNPHIQSWHFVPLYFTSHVWSHADPSGQANYYRPLFLLWLRINHFLFGLNPRWWHLATVLTHVGVTLLVYLFAKKIVRDRLTAGFAALVFGLHPVHVESVAWISGVTDPLLALLLIPAFLCYLNQRESRRHRRIWFALSLILYALGLLAKETATVLVVIVLAYEWNFWSVAERADERAARGEQMRAALWGAAPYLALTGVYALVRAIVLKGLAHPNPGLPLLAVAFTAPSLAWLYFKHLIWPVGLYALYDTMPSLPHPDLWNFAFPAAAIAVVALALVWWSKRSRTVAFATGWLALPIILVLNIQFFPKRDYAHDRYLYLPSIGFSILVAIALRSLKAGRSTLRGLPTFQIIPMATLAGLLALGTAYQSRYWKNDLAFAYHTVEGSPNSSLANNSLGFALAESGRVEEAYKLWQQILERDPNFLPSIYNLGYYHYRQGKFADAERYLLRAMEVNRSDPYPVLCLGLTRFKTGRPDEAEAAIRHAIELRPEGFGFHFALGFVLKTKGDRAGALQEFRAELVNNPRHRLAREQIREIEAYSPPKFLPPPSPPGLY